MEASRVGGILTTLCSVVGRATLAKKGSWQLLFGSLNRPRAPVSQAFIFRSILHAVAEAISAKCKSDHVPQLKIGHNLRY